jgi:amino acid transporter
VELTPKYLNNDYNTIISAARESYSSRMIPVSFGPFAILASIGITAGMANTYWNSYAAGEVRRGGVVKNQVVAMAGMSVLTILILLVIYTLSYSVAGPEFLVAFTQLGTFNAGFFNAPFFTATMALTFIPMMLANNPYLQLIIMIGMAGCVLTWIPYMTLVTTRSMFAWSFDRLIPAKFAEVSDRFHTPVFNILFNFGVGWICLVIFTYFSSYVLFFFAAAWATTMIGMTLTPLAAALLPLRKQLWNNSPIKKYMIGPIPAVTIFGLLGAFQGALGFWIFSTAPELGFGLTSLELLVALYVTPFLLYWIIRAYRRRQGIDLDLLFKEVPPE